VDSAKQQAVSLANDRWLLVLAVVLAAIIFVFPLTVHFPLLDPDEGLHASIAQEMVERGDWLAPHFLGEPFFDKPIFYFWCQALSLRLFGMNEAAVRLPGLMFGLLGSITTGLVGWRMFGRTTGWAAGIFYGTMILPVAMAQAASHDVALIPCINLAILFLWESERTRSISGAAGSVVVIGFLLGLTVLIKGLIGLALVGMAFGTYLLVARRWSMGVCLRGLSALAVAAIVALPWFIAVEIEHPGFLRYFFIQRHILGFATPTQLHGEAPWWYYLPVLIGGGLPWIGYLPVTISDALVRRVKKNETRKKENIRYQNEVLPDCDGLKHPHPSPLPKGEGTITCPIPKGEGTITCPLPEGEGTITCPLPKGEGTDRCAMALLFCWLIGCTFLLSCAHSKLATYLWPVFPAVAVLAAVGWAKLLDGQLIENARRSLVRTFFFSSISGPIVLPLALYVVRKIFVVIFPWQVWVAACLVGCAALIPLVFLRKQLWPAMLAASTLSTALQFVVALTLIMPIVAENLTARGLAEYFNQAGRIPVRLLVAEERLGSLVFYLDPALRLGLKDKQIDMIFYDQPTEVPPGTIIAMPERRGDQAYRYAELTGLPYKTVGRYRLYEIPGKDRRAGDGQ
jgi:Dolichyl-phosphate-mannose-protein mannosyltransferase